MVGLCAMIGSQRNIIDDLGPKFNFFAGKNTRRFDFGHVSAICVTNNPNGILHIESPSADILLYGEIHTLRTGNGHQSVSQRTAKSKVKEAYEKHGKDFVSKLNGEFAGLIEAESGEVTLFTDRLSTTPLFTTQAAGGMVVTTGLPVLLSGLDRQFTIDTHGLVEYFTFQRVFGTKTPIEEIDQLPPATLSSIEPSGDRSDDIYWVPSYKPEDWNRGNLVEELASIITTILRERMDKSTSYGLLLSGGSDSRFVLSLADEYDISAYTLGDWWNREVDTAHQAAAKADAHFNFLRRGENYHRSVLYESPKMSNFVSRFDQAHATGFAQRLSDEVDVLIHGMFADTFFKGHFLPVFELDTPIGEFTPPLQKRFDEVSEYISYLAETSVPDFIETEDSLPQILSENVNRKGKRLVHHGVEYRDLENAIKTSAYYPLTNQRDVLLYHSLQHIAPTITPFLDDRLIELHLSIPDSIQLRGKLINRALAEVSDNLATIPHSGTNVPLNQGFLRHFVGYNLTRARRNIVSPGGKPHYSNDPWPNQAELIRQNDFLIESITGNSAHMDDIEAIDSKSVHEVYDKHIMGEDSWKDLYTLATALEIFDFAACEE